MLIAVYDYLGYYNICHLGDEVIAAGQDDPASHPDLGGRRGRASI